MDLDSDRLAAFRAVARSGGFSRAAEKLHKTQPAVSQAVLALEQDVGEPLFLRLGRGVRLTPAGALLLEHVEEAFDALDRARARLAALRDLAEGELSIGTSDTTACYVLPPVLAAFRARHPGVELRLRNRPSPATERDVLAGEVELGFVTLPLESPRLSAEPLVVREDVAIFAPGHPLARRRRVRLADLLAHPLLLLDRGSRTRALVDDRLRELARSTGRRPQVAMELASIEVVKRLVSLDFGVSIVPRIAVTAEVEAGTLCSARVLPRSQARSVGVVYLGRTPPSRAARVFVEMARDRLRSTPGRTG